MVSVNKICVWLFLLFLVPVFLMGARRISLVDVNLDNAEKIMLIPEVDKKVSKAIVKYREENGYFDTIEELKNVSLINEELYKTMEPYLTITPAEEIMADALYEELDEIQEQEVLGEVDVDVEVLEDYKANPLDINSVTQSQLIELPYITQKIAKKIVRYRRKNRGFSSVKELKKILPDFIVRKISPFLTVIKSAGMEKFHGSLRLRYGLWPYPFSADYFEADPKYHNPQYFYGKYRIFYGNRIELGAVIRRDRKSLGIDYDNIMNYFLIKRYLMVRNTPFFDKVVIGNYNLDFAQGLFIQPNPFFIRSIPRKPKGLLVESGTNSNDGFYGLSGVKRTGSWEIFGFYSDKDMTVNRINTDGSIGDNAENIYDYFSTYLDMDNEEHFDNLRYLNEKLYGTRIKYAFSPVIALGGGFYEMKYDRWIDPSSSSGYDISGTSFRGDKIRLVSVDTEYNYRNIKLLLDAARSFYHTFDRTVSASDEYAGSTPDWYWGDGDAYQATAILKYDKFKIYASHHILDPDFYAFYSSPWMMGPAEQIPHRKINYYRNEKGYIVGVDGKTKKYELSLSFKYGSYIDYLDTTYNEVYQVYWLNTFKPTNKLIVSLRHWPTFTNREYTSGFYMPHCRIKNRVEITHTPSFNIRLKWRYEHIHNSFPDVGDSDSGMVTFGEIRYKPTVACTVYSRITYWDAGSDTTVGAMELLWPNALDTSGFYASGEKNYRWYIMPTMKLSKHAKLWLKYEFWPKNDSADKSVFKLQYDCSW